MSATAGIQKLESLKNYLDSLTERAGVKELRDHLESLDVSIDDVAEFVRFKQDGYQRNLVHEGPLYQLLVMCWLSGQRSPIHNHAESTCGVRVLSGVATETRFASTPSNLFKPVKSFDHEAESVSVSQDSDTHQISNLQEDGNNLVTLHIYSPPLLRMDTYSLTDSVVGEYRPMVVGCIEGDGI